MAKFEHIAYKHHAPCRKASVHRIFDKAAGSLEERKAEAIKAAKRFGIKESSARTWISGFAKGRGDCAAAREYIAKHSRKRAAKSA